MDDRIKIKERVKGAIWGLAAGDRNGGPIRMSLRLAKSLLSQKKFSKDDVISSYYNWYRGPPYDTEIAFDTGVTFRSVFSYHKNGMSIDDAADKVWKATNSAGINGAHRSPPLACCGFISDNDLVQISKEECTITHKHPISVEIANAFTVLLRNLILGHSWELSVNLSKKYVQSYEGKLSYNIPEFDKLSKDGFAPNVFQATLAFMTSESDFSNILENSIAFAGSSNYCPVLVGALAGALYGVNAIKPSDLTHCEEELKNNIESIATQLSETWMNEKLN